MRRRRLRATSTVRKPKAKRSPVKRSPRKRKQWTEEAMLAAIESVKAGASVSRAAREHGVPRTTLQDRHLGRVRHGTKSGPQPYLTMSEEKELAEFIDVAGSVGFGRTRSEVMNIAQSVAAEKGILQKQKISHGWFQRFCQRNPHLRLRKGDSTANVRMDAMSNTEALQNYFIVLKNVLEENDLMEKPAQIYNVDESGMPLDHHPPKVLARKGQKKVRYRTSGNKSQITVIGCVNATGTAMPPFVIFAAKSLNMEWTKGEVPGTTYGLSSNGWIDMGLFKGWFTDHFLKHAVSSRPLLLLLDGHSSHYNPEAVRLAKEHDVIMLTLVPHTTHAMQPLDISVFGPLKAHWREACHKYMQNNPGKIITKYQFSALLSEAWMKTMCPSTIISGFRTCGVYPFNPEAVLSTSPIPVSEDAHAHHLEQEDISPGNEAIVFTESEEERFARRYEEGYDLYDERYSQWLKLTHSGTGNSVVDHFCDVAVCTPLIPIPQNEVSPSLDVDQQEQTSMATPLQINPSMDPNPETTPSGSCNSSQSDIISKYLVQYVPVTPKSRWQSSSHRVSGSRVLTSAAGLAMLKEKEDKKKRDLEEKERKKKDREEKKKQKEEVTKRKLEEKAAKRKNTTTVNTRNSKRPKQVVDTAVPISSPNAEWECCECSRTYEEDVAQCSGAEWVQCSCNRWLHEECINIVDSDSSGNEIFCSFCLINN